MVAKAVEGVPNVIQVVTISDDGDSPVLIEDAHLLFSADFERVGDSLLLTGETGDSVMVVDYFAMNPPLGLVSETGGVLSADLIEALVGPDAPGQYAQVVGQEDAEPIGQVETLTGAAQATRADGTVVPLTIGTPVFQGDVLQTGAGSRLNVSFVDNTVFSLSGNARMVLNEVVYSSPQSSGNSMIMSLIQGAFTFITGEIAPSGNMQVNTPVVNIGIRGTTVHVALGLDDGAVSVSISNGFVEFFDPQTGNQFFATGDTDNLFTFSQPGILPEQTPKSLEVLEEEQERANEVESIKDTVSQRTDLDDDQIEEELQRAELDNAEEIADQSGRSGSSTERTVTEEAVDGEEASGQSDTPQAEDQDQDTESQDTESQIVAQGSEPTQGDSASVGEAPADGGTDVVPADEGGEAGDLAQQVADTLNDEPAPLVTGAGPGAGGQAPPSGGIGTVDEPDFGTEELVTTDVDTSVTNTTITTSPPPSASDSSVSIGTFSPPAPFTSSSEPAPVLDPAPVEPSTPAEPDETPAKAAPVLGNNSLVVSEGETVVLGPANLSATDPETADSDLVFSVSAVQNGQFERVASPGAAITSFTQAEINAGDVQFVHDGSEGPPSYSVTVDNGESAAAASQADTGGYSNVNDAPRVDLNGTGGGVDSAADFTTGGQPVNIMPANAEVSDPDSAALDSVTVSITNPQDSGFEFLQADTAGTNITIAGNGGPNLTLSGGDSLADYQQVLLSVTYQNTAANPTSGERNIQVRADDGASANNFSEIATAVVTVIPDAPPVLTGNALSLSRGDTVVISTNDLSATDIETDPADLVFLVSGVQNGRFELTTSPGISITSFTQEQVAIGSVQFVHDGSTNAAAYEIAVSDGVNTTAPVAATIDFQVPNNPPVLGNNSLTISEGETVVLRSDDLSANDPDGNEADLIFTVSGVQAGQFELVALPGQSIVNFTQAQISDGDVQFVHDGGEVAPSYSIAVSDGETTIASVAASIDFIPVNDLPVLGANTLSLDEGDRVILGASNLSASDAETPDSDLVFTVSDIENGQFEFTLSPGSVVTSFTQAEIVAGAIAFAHDGGDAAPSYSVSVSDGSGATPPAVAVIDFGNLDDPPLLQNNSLAVEEGASVALSASNLSATDTETNDADLIFTVSNVQNGQFELVTSPGIGVVSFTQAQITAGAIQFVHDGGEVAPSYSVSVSDGTNVTVAEAANISFTNVNDPPLLVNNSLTLNEGDSLVLSGSELSATDIEANDADLIFTISNAENGQFEALAAPGVAITSFTQAQITAGQVVFAHDGSDTAPSYFVSVSDGQDATAPAAAAVDFGNLNDPPLLVNNNLDVDEGETVVLTAASLSATDSETDDADLVFTISSLQNGEFQFTTAPGLAVTSFSQAQITAGTVQFVHDGGEAAPSYDVTVSDGEGGSAFAPATITFGNLNDAPELGNNALSLDEGETVVLSAANLSATDVETNDADLVFTVSAVQNGQFELVAAPGVAVDSFTQAQISAGAVQFAHDGGDVAPSYAVAVSDGTEATTPVAAAISFGNLNDPPIVVNNSLNLSEGETVVLSSANISATDAESDDADLVFTVSNVQNGRFELVAAPGSAISSFTQAQIIANAVQFVHDGGEAQPSYSLSVSDGVNSVVVSPPSIIFTNVNDAPVLGANELTVTEGESAVVPNIDLSADDVETPSADLIYTISDVEHGQFELLSAPGIAVTSFTQGQVNNTQVRFVHDGGEEAPSYRVSVSDGEDSTPPVAASITFVMVNDVAVVDLNGADGASFLEGSAAQVVDADLTVSDDDTALLTGAVVSIENIANPGAEILSAVTAGTNITANYDAVAGSLTLSGSDTQANYQQVLRSVTYLNQSDDPAVGGNNQRSIRYTVNDGIAAGVAAIAFISVVGVNDAPVAAADSGETEEDAVLSVTADGVLANDSDPESDNILSVSSVEGAAANVGTQITLASGALLTMNADGSYEYDPNGAFDTLQPGDSTTDGFTYKISDGVDESDAASVVITINGQQNDTIIDDTEEDVVGAGATLFANELIVAESNSAVLRVGNGGEVTADSTIVALNSGSNGTIEVNQGGALTTDSLEVGRGGTGSVTVDGAGARLAVGREDLLVETGIRLGGQNGGTGSFTASGGALVESMFFDIGRAGTGSLSGQAIIRDPGTIVNLDNRFGNFGPPFENSGGILRVARNNGDVGELSVLNGAVVNIAAGTGEVEPGVLLAEESGSQATVTIDSATINITQTTPANPGNDDFGPFVSIGRGGSAEMTLSNGAELNLSGEETDILIGEDAGADGGLRVSGPNSSVVMSGNSAYVAVGVNGIGGITVTSDASVTLSDPGAYFEIAAEAGSAGAVNIEQGGKLTTRAMEVGGGGTGALFVDGVGSTLTVGTEDSIDPGLYVGGFSGGSGEVTVSGGATLNAFNFDIGRGRTGSLSGIATIRDPGTVVNIDSRFGDFEGPSGLPENNGGFLRAARNDGDVGELHILNGAVVNIEAGSQETEPEFQLGRNQGSRGIAVISAATLNISQTAPADVNPSEGSLGGPLLRVGRGGEGDLTVQNGGQINMTGENSALFVGRFATADGTFIVDGLGSQVNLSGDGAHFSIGTEGTGSAAIRGGASVELTDAGSTVTIAENAGSTGSLVISEGGTLTTLALEVGQGGDGTLQVDGSGSVLTVGAADLLVDTGIRVGGFNGGTGTFIASGGALVESMFIDIGRGATGSLSGVGIIRDPGTVVNLDNRFGHFGPPFENNGGALRVARNAGDIGELSVLNGATVNIAAGPDEVEPGFQIAREAGSQGTVLVDSSSINITQSAPADPGNEDFGPFVQVGRTGSGSLIIQNGGSVNLAGEETGFTVGRDAGADGTVSVNGLGSKIALSGNSAFFAVGNAGAGTMTIRNSASVELLDTGSYFEVAAEAGSTGTLNIEQGGSLTTREMEVGSGGTGLLVLDGIGSTLTVGTADSIDPGLYVGGFDGGFGEFTVSGGATLNALNFQVGRGATGTLSGVATIRDAGTVVNLDNRFGHFSDPFQDDGGFLRVARNDGDIGELNILAGAVINIGTGLTESEPGFQIARNEGSRGTVVVDSATVNMTQTTPSDPGNDVFGPYLQVGRGGTGTVTVRNGGRISQTGDDSNIAVGRLAGSQGTLLVDGPGSEITMQGGRFASLVTGWEGEGTTTFQNGANLELSGDGVGIDVGREDGAVGDLNILSGSQLTMSGGTDEAQFRIGRFEGSEGIVVVEGTNSLLSVTGPSGFSTRIAVGDRGTGTLETRDGGHVAVSRMDIGAFKTGVGTALVDNATWNIGADGMNIGRENVGSLEIRNSATVNAERARVGWTGGSNGTIELDATSQLNVGLIQVGHGFYDPIGDPDFGIDTSAFGTFNLTGGTVNANETRIGNHERGIGVVVMDGGTWNDVTRLEVGTQGNGTLSLQNGALFTSDGDFGVIANAGGAMGVVTVDATSQLQINGFFSIGNGFFDPVNDPDFGQDDTATGSLVINGGTVSIEDGNIGGLARGDGSVLLNGGNFDIATHLSVAHEGTAALTITNGGVVTSNSASVGNTVGSDGSATIGTVGGAGTPASWNVTNTLSIGHGDVAQAAVASGLVTVAKDSTLTATNIDIEEGGTLNTADKGTVNGNINLLGGTHVTGESPGTAIINGNFTMTSGVLDVEAGGLASGQFDLMEISGEASLLSGLVDFSFIDGYLAETGDEIEFLTADAGVTVDVDNLSLAVSGVNRDFTFDLTVEADSLSFLALSDAEEGESTIFLGGALDDSFSGGQGDDLLAGGGGADKLTGGEGADIFAFERGDGGDALSLADLITDFEEGVDKIGLADGLVFSDLTVGVNATGSSVVEVTDTGEILAVVDGITPNLLDEQDFLVLV